MKRTILTMLMSAGALSAGGAAAYLSHGYIERSVQQRRAEIDAQYSPVRVVVANADLRAGTFLSVDRVALREVPRAFLHSDAILADQWSGFAGRVISHPLRSGEPILQSHLSREVGAGFSSQLPHGMRALTVPVDDESSIAGMLAPGDRIDILFTTTTKNESVTVPLLSNVIVVATGARTSTNSGYLDERRVGSSYATVKLSVSPGDAAKIALAQDVGKIAFMLRQPQDVSPVPFERMTKTALLHAHPNTAAAPRRRVEIILGGIRS